MTPERFIDIARNIADGAKVDWTTARRDTSSDKDRRVVRALEMLARIRELSASTDVREGGDRPLPCAWGDVTLVERIGSGSFGTVYRAVDEALGLEVAIKILTPRDGSERTRLLDEGRRLARLRHGGIVRVYGVDTQGSSVGLRMELLEGRTLAEWVKDEGPAPERHAERIGISVCQAVGSIHAAGLLHRDIKASNVMREEDGRVVVMDLGAGIDKTHLVEDRSRLRLTGTPMYAAPEVLNGQDPSVASDVYAIGVLLFFLASGTYPIDATDLDDVWNAHRHDDVRSLSAIGAPVSPRFEAIVARAMSPTPAARFESAAELAQALANLLEEATERSPSKPKPVTAHNLSRSLSRFVGRAGELQKVGDALVDGSVLTLVGAGGCGKTRLAREVAERELTTDRTGVWFCDLTLVEAGEDVVRKVATTVGARESENKSPMDAVVERVSAGRTLLVLDNCEHLVEAVAAFVSDVLARCSSLSVIATSRTPLGLANESLLDVSPLDVPDADATLDVAGENDSVRVFLASARRVRPDFELTASNVSNVCAICRALDGIPLALELAAGGLRAFDTSVVASQVQRALPTERRVDRAQPHHETLRATIEWSLNLVSADATALFEWLSVCVGGWNLDLAEALAPARASAVGCLSELVNASLVETRFPSGGSTGDARYRMLEPVRLLAADRFRRSRHAAEARARHRRYVESLTHAAAQELRGKDQAYWFARLAEDHENVSHAMRTSVSDGDPALGCRIAFAASRYWYVRGHWAEARALVEPLADLRNGRSTEADRANALNVLANLASFQGDNAAARESYERALTLRRTLGDDAALASSLNDIGVHAHHEGRHADALRHLEESLTLRRRLDNRPGLAQVLNNIGSAALAIGDFDRAREVLEEALAIREELGDRWGVGVANLNLGKLDVEAKRYDDAIRRFELAIAIHEPLGERWGVGIAHSNLGGAYRAAGRGSMAWPHAAEAVRILTELGDRAVLQEVVVGCAILAVLREAFQEGATLLGYVEQLLEETKASLPGDREAEYGELRTTLEERLDANRLAAAKRQGANLSTTELVALVDALAAAASAE